jgi:hypothetical protein
MRMPPPSYELPVGLEKAPFASQEASKETSWRTRPPVRELSTSDCGKFQN